MTFRAQTRKNRLKTAPAKPSKTPRKGRGAGKPAYRIVESESSVSFLCDARAHGPEPILGAAYLFTDRAFVRLDGDRAKTISVELRSKAPAGKADLVALAEAFSRERETQVTRWAISKNNQPIREYLIEQAVLLANDRLPAPESSAAAPIPADEQLTESQRAEIERLIAEVEGEIKAMNDKKTVADPKGIKASWEEKHEHEPEARP